MANCPGAGFFALLSLLDVLTGDDPTAASRAARSIRGSSSRRLPGKFRSRRWRVDGAGNLHCGIGWLQTKEAGLDSYGRLYLGATVPAGKSGFGCCGRLFGGEIAP